MQPAKIYFLQMLAKYLVDHDLLSQIVDAIHYAE
jgi:hypothetical protein